MIVAIGIILGTILTTQFGGAVLQLHPLDLSQWLVIFGVSVLIIPFNFLRCAALRMQASAKDKK